jgi:hypothetical protein
MLRAINKEIQETQVEGSPFKKTPLKKEKKLNNEPLVHTLAEEKSEDHNLASRKISEAAEAFKDTNK